MIFQVNCVNRQLFLSQLIECLGWSKADVASLYERYLMPYVQREWQFIFGRNSCLATELYNELDFIIALYLTMYVLEGFNKILKV